MHAIKLPCEGDHHPSNAAPKKKHALLYIYISLMQLVVHGYPVSPPHRSRVCVGGKGGETSEIVEIRYRGHTYPLLPHPVRVE